MFGLFGKKKGAEDPGRLRGEIWIVEGYRLGEKWSLDEGEIKIGRGLEDPRAINFPDNAKFISGEHAVFRKGPAGYTLTDLDSTNGTFLKGKRVKGTVALADGDEIGIGQVTFRVRIGAIEETADQEAELVIVRGTFQGQRMSLDGGELLVGREIEGEGTLSFPDTEKGISTEHAIFRKNRGGYWVQDLSSKNGTFVNGKQKSIAQLADGDEVTLGDVAFKVHIRKKGS